MRFSRYTVFLGGSLALVWAPATLAAQALRSLSRAEAVQAGLARAPRFRLAQGDTALAGARLLDSRLFPDLSVSLGYSRSAPRYHVSLDLPLDPPWLRSKRIEAADFSRAGSRWRLAFERAATALDVDTAYTRALAAREKLALSVRNARDADSLRLIAIARREAGDAAELDVQLAEIFAGQQANRETADSLASDDALLSLQATMGMADRDIVIAVIDALDVPTAPVVATSGSPLLVAAAEADLQSAAANASFARRNWIGSASLTAGFETGDDSEPGMLPTVGIALPLPIFNRNRGGAATASAEQQRAAASLAAVRIEMATERARAERALHAAMAQLTRDGALLRSADRVSAMSLTAYREGAASLASVLEAQRSTREVRAQYLDDLVGAWIARGIVILLSESATSSRP